MGTNTDAEEISTLRTWRRQLEDRVPEHLSRAIEVFEEQIERMETDADLVNLGRKPDLEEEFRRLKGDEDIDKELEALKAKKGGSG